jgi:hypothetical protein
MFRAKAYLRASHVRRTQAEENQNLYGNGRRDQWSKTQKAHGARGAHSAP